MASIIGEASSSSPPSASIPPPRPRSRTYDVFLSFRGEDTRNGITSHLNAALERRGIKTFVDDNDLETGEVISSKLLKAIEESMFAITVFSPNYASSCWCLDELQHIVECSNKLGLSIVPVFYGVEPYHVRRQKGSFGEGFRTQEDRFGQNSEKVRRWGDALVQLANVSGFDFKDEHEATLVESIADHIHKKLIPKLPSSTKNLVGIASRVEEVMRHIGIRLNISDVCFIGIWGMSGIGKTTIAREVYKAIQGEFKVSCFLANVREACERNSIVQIQKELVDQANISANTFCNEYDGQRIIQNSLCKEKVLLVLDDISNENQLRNLAGEQDWFGPGSRIIITTRDIQLLKIYEVHGTYKVQGLVNRESFDLFCLKAFKQKMPREQYLNLANEVVKYSGGLPLALEVLGSHLCQRPIDVWHSAIEKIKSTPINKIHNTLKISYDSLDPMEKNIFLDIACFFKGKNTNYVIGVLNKCGYSAEICIAILIDRCLVRIDEYEEDSNVFEMHDLLQDMGRSIVIQESPNNPCKRSRLWSQEDIHLVLANNKGYAPIQGIVFQPDRFDVEQRHWSTFSNMAQLKLLIMDTFGRNFQYHDHSSLPTWLKVLHCCGYFLKILSLPDQQYELSSLPTSLKVLHWRGYPFKTLPLSDQQYELVDIRLTGSAIENLWHGKKFLGKLEHLDLTSSQLKRTPDISEVPKLQTLVLKQCTNLTEVHPSVVQHKKLTLLDLTDCYNLECLPDITNGLPLLRTLKLSDCHLTEESFPPDFGPFPSLTCLDLSYNDFVRMPINIHGSPKLEWLQLNSCKKLQCWPELPLSIRRLDAYHCWSLDISEFNILSTVCGAFVSPRQDPGQVLLEMVVLGSEIPSWFVHRQDGNSLSIPCDYPPNERLGIALCCLIHARTLIPSLNGDNRFITNEITPICVKGSHLYTICLTNDYFDLGFRQGTRIELSILDKHKSSEVLVTTAAR